MQFLVVTLTTAPQVHPDPVVRERLQRELAVTDLDYPDRRIRRLGQTEGFAVLNLATELRAFAQARHEFLHGFGSGLGTGHWNEQGHRLAGRRIAREICALMGR